MIRFTVSIIILMFGKDSFTQSQLVDAGFGYEVIESKLDFLELRFTELLVQLKEQAEEFLNNQQRMENTQQQLNSVVENHERKIIQLVEGIEYSFGSNVSLLNDNSRRIFELQTICSNHDLIRNSLFELRPKNEPLRSQAVSTNNILTPTCSRKVAHETCLMTIGNERILVYQEQQRFGGNWLVVLQRFDGSEGFNRNWIAYRKGFGTVGQEFWLGLERLHLLTKSASHELLIELEDFKGNYRYARYDKFAVGPEEDNYPLVELGKHSGTAGNSLIHHKGSSFSTIDHGAWKHCSDDFKSGWWYGVKTVCYEVNLTGKWENINDWNAIVWKSFGTPDNLGLKFARMMIRKI